MTCLVNLPQRVGLRAMPVMLRWRQVVWQRPGSSPDKAMWDLWWTKRHCGRFLPSTSVPPATHSTDCLTLIIIHHPGLVQEAKQWPTCQVDSVSTHPQKQKKNQDGVGVVTVFTLISFYISPVTHKIFHTVLSGVLVFTISGRDVHVYLTMPSVAQTVPASNDRFVNQQ
jgi:hypothetical protein